MIFGGKIINIRSTNQTNQKQKYLVHFAMVFFKLGRTASKVLPEHAQKYLLAHCQSAMTDVSELQVWLLVDRVLGKKWTMKESQMNSKHSLTKMTGEDINLPLSLYKLNV